MKKTKNDFNSNSTVLSFNSHSYVAGSTIEESSSTLLQKLHTNERQLRTLAVVLSLTGGLALSFALGVGIMIYWYCHKYKQKGIFEDGRLFNDNESDDDDDEKSTGTTNSSGCSCDCNYYGNDSNTISNAAIEEQIEQQIVHINNSSTIIMSQHRHGTRSNSSSGSISMLQQSIGSRPTTNNNAAETLSNNSLNDILLLPLPDLPHVSTPEPSAPSAKELHLQAEHNTSNTNSSNTNAIELEEQLCHDCSIPPPAYTRN
ncbi:unnamed protein product [Mucor hiemalis]